MRALLLTVAACCAAAACSHDVEYSTFPGYMQAARGTWPLVYDRPFPAPFTNDHARALHAAITERTGIRPESFPDYSRFFLAACCELERARAAEAAAAIDSASFEERLGDADATACVREYLAATLQGRRSPGSWIGCEPRLGFDRLADYADPRATGVEEVETRWGRIRCRLVASRCRVADVRGKESEQVWVFQVAAVAGRPGIWQAVPWQ